MLIYTEQDCPQLKNVFGIHSYSMIKSFPLDMEVIKKEALKLYKKGTFKIECKRAEKLLLPSPEIEREMGEYIVKNKNAKVKLKEPDITIYIEISNKQAHLYNKKNKGLGGLPVGIQGTVGLLLQDKSSIEAGLKLMKRGCAILLIKEKDIDLMIMGWKGFSHTRGSVFGGTLDDVVMNAECDVVMVKMVQLDKMKNLLIPTSGGPHASYSLELVPAIANHYKCAVTVCMVVPPGVTQEKEKNYQNIIDTSIEYLTGKVKKVQGKLVHSKRISAGILKESEKFDACIIGAAREGLMQQILFGSIPERIAKKTRHTLIMVKKHQSALQNIMSRLFKRPTGRTGKR